MFFSGVYVPVAPQPPMPRRRLPMTPGREAKTLDNPCNVQDPSVIYKDTYRICVYIPLTIIYHHFSCTQKNIAKFPHFSQKLFWGAPKARRILSSGNLLANNFHMISCNIFFPVIMSIVEQVFLNFLFVFTKACKTLRHLRSL